MTEPARKKRILKSARIDPGKPAYIVIDDRFGGLAKFCRLTGIAIGTAQRWRTQGVIPARRRDGSPCHAHILAVAAEHRIKINPADFVERPEQMVANG